MRLRRRPDPLVLPRPELLDTALSLSQTQLIGQLADETSLDGRTMGTLGFSGALLATVVAAKDVLGPAWWTPLVAVGAATICCLGPALGISGRFSVDTDLGPGATAFYAAYGAQDSALARQQLLADLGEAFDNNASRLRAKRGALRLALVILAIGLIASAVAIDLSRPSSMSRSHGTSHHATA